MHIHLFGHIFRLLYSDILLYIYFLQKKNRHKNQSWAAHDQWFPTLIKRIFYINKNKYCFISRYS